MITINKRSFTRSTRHHNPDDKRTYEDRLTFFSLVMLPSRCQNIFNVQKYFSNSIFFTNLIILCKSKKLTKVLTTTTVSAFFRKCMWQSMCLYARVWKPCHTKKYVCLYTSYEDFKIGTAYHFRVWCGRLVRVRESA